MWGSDMITLKSRAGRICITVFFIRSICKIQHRCWNHAVALLEKTMFTFLPQMLFSGSHPESQKALASHAHVHLFGCADPQSPVSLQHTPSQIPSGSSFSFLLLPLIQRDFSGVIAPTAWGWLHPASTRENTHLPRADSNCCVRWNCRIN